MSQQNEELKFWKQLHDSTPNYIDFRASEYEEKTKNFPGFAEQKGKGIDLGCGLVSVLEKSDKIVLCVDPLMDEYLKIVPQETLEKAYRREDGENLSLDTNSEDWVMCVNVIDHTPDSQKMSDEIYRVLKPGGKLYFEVNGDDNLSPAHYRLWSKELITTTFSKFKLIHELDERVEENKQWRYWRVYEK